MDKEYLQNIAGSNFVDEDLGSRILSRGTAGAQRLAAMTGGQFSDINYTKIESLFGGFLRRITKVLYDFAGGPHSIANRLEQRRPPITPEQQSQIEKLKDLYNAIVPSIFSQSQLTQSILNPRGSRSNLTEMLKEGIWSRDMALNYALQSNDPVKILNAYTDVIKREFSSFMRDAVKTTGTTRDYIYSVVRGLNPKWMSVLKKSEQITYPDQSQPQTQQPSRPPTQPSSPPVPPSPANKEQASNDDFANVIDRVVEIVIETVKADTERAEKFLSGPGIQKDLPTDWEAPSITKEAEEPEVDDGPEKVEEPTEEEPESKGEFLYNFHSKYDRQRNFSIDINPPNDQLTLIKISGNNKTKKLNVIWNNRSHENNIYVKHTDVSTQKNPIEGEPPIVVRSKSIGNVLLMRFWDDQVNPRNLKSKQFSVRLLLEQANPKSVQMFDGANPRIKASIEQKSQNFLRALYATTFRKTMEFKRKPFSLEADEEGNLFRIKRNGEKEPISQEQLQAYLNSKDPKERERWKTSLDKIGYFTKFPGAVPKPAVGLDKIPNAMDAIASLKTLGYKAMAAMKAVQKSVESLGPDASTEDYVKLALKEPKEEPEPTTPGVSSEPSGPATPENPDSKISGGASAPVSGGASEPVTTEPSAPVSSKKPAPDKEPSKPKTQELGKASWDEKGVITWEKPDGKTVKITPNQFKKMKIPRLELLLKNMGYFDKFPVKEDLNEEFINPFDLSNLL